MVSSTPILAVDGETIMEDGVTISQIQSSQSSLSRADGGNNSQQIMEDGANSLPTTADGDSNSSLRTTVDGDNLNNPRGNSLSNREIGDSHSNSKVGGKEEMVGDNEDKNLSYKIE